MSTLPATAQAAVHRSAPTIAFIGSAGIPNRYGGFEAFLEHCAPEIVRQGAHVIVTCDASMYEDRAPMHCGVQREFIAVRANGAPSAWHDMVAFARVYRRASHIVVLGVSGGLWFPLWRLACAVGNRRLLVNIDGIEWRRAKYGAIAKALLRLFDALAQLCAHRVVYDNAALREFVLPSALSRATEIAYPGDHVRQDSATPREPGTALTICRIEPENNLEMLIEGFLSSPLHRYTIVGNWHNSDYGRALREHHRDDRRLQFLDPIYDAERLARLRAGSEVYLHGHSVGGTNPSLVEMLFYDGEIACFDCAFNRHTAGAAARYFTTQQQLGALLQDLAEGRHERMHARALARQRFTRENIARSYIDAATASGTT